MKSTPVSTVGPTSKVGKTIQSLSAAELLRKRLVSLGFAQAQRGLPPSLVQELETKVGGILDASIQSLEVSLRKSREDGDKRKKVCKEKAAARLAALEEKHSARKKKIETDAMASLTKEVETAVTAAVLGRLLAASMANPQNPITTKTSVVDTTTATEPKLPAAPQADLPITPAVPPAASGDDLFDKKADGETK